MQLTQFLVHQLDYIFFFYGLGFILLAGICATFRQDPRRRLPWIWLGLFGLTRGVNEWLDMLALSLGDSASFSALRLAVMGLSFIFLIEFGREGVVKLQGKGIGRWIYLPLLIGAASGWLAGGSGLSATTRYFLGLSGGLFSAWALFRASRTKVIPSASLRFAALLMALYGVAADLVVSQAGFFPASVLNHSSFLALTGFPIQLLRGILAILITVMIWQYYQNCNQTPRTQKATSNSFGGFHFVGREINDRQGSYIVIFI